MTIISYKQFQVSFVNFSKPVKRIGNYYAKLSYNGEDQTLIQFPRMKCVDGLKKSKTRDFIDLLIPEDNESFTEFLKNLDRMALRTSVNKSEEWFTKSIPQDLVEDMYRPNLRVCPETGKRFMRVTIPNDIDVFNDKKLLVNRDSIEKDNEIISMFQILGLKYSKNTFEYVVKAVSLKVSQPRKPKVYYPKKIKLSGYSFIDSDDETDELGIEDEDLFFDEEEQQQEDKKENENEKENEKDQEQEEKENESEEDQEEKESEEDQEDEDMKLRKKFNLPADVDITKLKKELMPKPPVLEITTNDDKEEDEEKENENENVKKEKTLDSDFDTFDLTPAPEEEQENNVEIKEVTLEPEEQ